MKNLLLAVGLLVVASDFLSAQPLPGSKESLNPQPLPPKVQNGPQRLSPGSKQSLNPQPLPPKVQNSQ